jgi:cysteine-rich repeat protein
VLNAVLFAALVAWMAACGDDGPLQAAADVPGVRDALPDTPPSLDTSVDIARDAGADPADRDATDLPGTDLPDPGPTTDLLAEVLPGPCPAPGALIITELLPDPAAVPDQTGEWVEVHNPGVQDLDLRGIDLRSGRESHPIAGGSPVLVPAGGFLLLGASANAADNGGIVPGYVYDSIRLSNQADGVALVCGDLVIDGMSWVPASSPLAAGRSLALDRSGFDATRNDDAAYWCRGSEAFGAGDRGTPGADNPPCSTSSCGDRTVQRWEECDDGNALPGDGCTSSCRAESFQAGSIIVTEFLVRPEGVGQTVGQWVELHNTTDVPIDIAGWTLGDEAGAGARILPAGGSLVAPPLGYVVLGRSADPEANGGVAVDWAYGDRFPLASPRDRIVVTWNDTVIDRVEYDLGTTFPEASGRSLQLDPDFLDAGWNDWGEAWCPAPDGVVLDDGDRGSPGAANPPCQWPIP